ncbi:MULTISPECIES: hypothetical protein [unclassified Saccharothrix]|uniref:hypothetical protein n=1 Tax=unclassified Saccharothrix TaxID=2593673 RepID=UPI00307EA142
MRRVLPFVALLAAACTTAPPQAAPDTASVPATMTTTTVAPAELAPKRIRAAVLPANALERLGVTEPGTDSDRHRPQLPLPCAKPKTSGQDVFGYHVPFARKWKNSRMEFNHLVTWYEDRTGAEAVAKTREMAESCREYVYSTRDVGDLTIHVTAPVDLPAPAGVSAAYAYCEDNGTNHACWGLIAHGDLMATLIVFSASHERSLGAVADMLPDAAALLLKD